MQRLGLLLTELSMNLPTPLLAEALTKDEEAKQKLCEGAGLGCPDGKAVNKTDLSSGLTDGVNSITNTLLYVAGAIAVIVIIIGGLRYVTSTGDATRIKQAK